MPKDNENDNETFRLLKTDPSESPVRSFTPGEMVRCESCLRANPPTRASCLYCGAALPLQPAASVFQKPALRPLEKWEHGYNNILLPPAANLTESVLAETADFLRLEKEELERIIASDTPLPLARSSSKEEAELIQHRLRTAQLASVIVADASLGLEPPIKLRALEFHDDGVSAYQSPQAQPQELAWNDFVLLVSGRITRKRVELQEARKGKENRVLAADQFFADESVVDLFVKQGTTPYRIASGSFDFSCLAEKKRLVAAENMAILIEVFRERIPGLVYDQTYNPARKTLEPVWRSEQQNESTGWRRGGPGRVSLGSATETSNESQFSRYSRLRFYLRTQPQLTDINA
ncbi:MAG TPA: hypothetical protein VHR36_05625 [Pyrinomonadaceae bacterium]|nr:hypothetical protein [Pyrinomonadaceae bacterium]